MRMFLFVLLLFTACSKSDSSQNDRNVEITKVIEYTSLTLTNYSNAEVNLSGWKLVEEISFFTVSTKEYVFPSINVGKGTSITFSGSQLGFRLQKPDEMVYLYDKSGKLVDQMSWVSFQ